MNKIPAQVHILIGQTPIPIAFPDDASAEKQWRLLADMLARKDQSAVIVHEEGVVWINLPSVLALTWTKEKRVQPQMPGIMAPAPGMRMS